jgi:dolichol-phosphate mannosyltransferase
MPSPSPRLSVVIAVYNEAENIEAVGREVLTALAPVGEFEVIFVDDGSSDATAARVRALADPRVRLIRQTRSGKSQALRTGIEAARGAWIGTMDGDGQNDPADIVAMAELAWGSAGTSPLVCGIRRRREDPWSRKVATRIGNGIRNAFLRDGCPDTGCGLKLFERGAFLRLPVFEGMHRFLPALFARYGHPQVLHDVRHRPRAAGQSKYTNWGRALVGVGDLFGVAWLRARTRAPTVLGEG